jgi:hypothetical protein
MSASLKSTQEPSSKSKSHALALVGSTSKKKSHQPSKFEKSVRAVPTERDHALALQLVTLYKDKATPEMLRQMVFKLFWDLCQHYDVLSLLPKNFTRYWLKLWPALLARVGREGNMPTHISYTWEPSAEEEAELEAEEKEETDARAVFEVFHNQSLPPVIADELRDTIDSILNAAHPTSSFEVFRVAWPVALERYESETEESGDNDLQAKLKRELNADASALARLLNSETFPPSIKELLGEQILSMGAELSEKPEVIKAQYPLIVMQQMQTENSDE